MSKDRERVSEERGGRLDAITDASDRREVSEEKVDVEVYAKEGGLWSEQGREGRRAKKKGTRGDALFLRLEGSPDPEAKHSGDEEGSQGDFGLGGGAADAKSMGERNSQKEETELDGS